MRKKIFGVSVFIISIFVIFIIFAGNIIKEFKEDLSVYSDNRVISYEEMPEVFIEALNTRHRNINGLLNLFVSHEFYYDNENYPAIRSFRVLVLEWYIKFTFPKDEVYELFVNNIEYTSWLSGSRNACYYLFDKDFSDLNDFEYVLLAHYSYPDAIQFYHQTWPNAISLLVLDIDISEEERSLIWEQAAKFKEEDYEIHTERIISLYVDK